MKQPIIEVSNLSKVYNISHQSKPSYGSIRDEFSRWIRKPLELMGGSAPTETEKFWALKDVSFSVNQGEIIGIIGKNGSGKSTLLKILSRIVDPTRGEAILRGNAASLLEVGTGFHPELTGRENIFLNGSILGMSKREIAAKFDEIVDFSEIEKFLDTPVKFYSSGMYVRLAFAVAAHLDPEILIVDEVLAVGDAAFQKKSLGRMNKVAREGRTVLFVSHSVGSIRDLCTRGLLLEDGQATYFENVGEAIRTYQQQTSPSAGGKLSVHIKKRGMLINNFSINSTPASEVPGIFSDEPIRIGAAYTAEPGMDLCMGFYVKSKAEGCELIYTHSHLEGVKHTTRPEGAIEVILHTPKLAPGDYTLGVNVWLDGDHVVDSFDLVEFNIMPSPAFRSKLMTKNFPAALMISSDWSFS